MNQISKTLLLTSSLAAATAATAQLTYRADIDPLNDSGVHGVAEATIDGDTLWIGVYVSDLETGVAHAQHIHGRFDGSGNPMDSVFPTAADDADGDGFIEVLEGVSSYGDVILPLGSPPPTGNNPGTISFQQPNFDGTFIFEQTYDLGNEGSFFSPVTGTSYSGADLLPLDLREIVIHGMTVDGSAGAGTEGEIDGTAGYKAVLPIAAGEFVAIPEPAAAGLGGLGLLGLLLLTRRRRQA